MIRPAIPYSIQASRRGFTLIELMIVLAATAILLAIAFPSYRAVMDKKDLTKTIEDLNVIATALDQKYYADSQYPETLAEIGMDSMRDPWGNAYYFVNLKNPDNVNLSRKDRFLHPVNNDFDLYSGSFFGLAKDY